MTFVRRASDRIEADQNNLSREETAMNTAIQDAREAQAMWNRRLEGSGREGIALNCGRRPGRTIVNKVVGTMQSILGSGDGRAQPKVSPAHAP
jgi:hypothetical protein